MIFDNTKDERHILNVIRKYYGPPSGDRINKVDGCPEEMDGIKSSLCHKHIPSKDPIIFMMWYKDYPLDAVLFSGEELPYFIEEDVGENI